MNPATRRAPPPEGTPANRLLRPAYDGGSIVNLAPTILRATGGEPALYPDLAPGLRAPLDPFRGGRADGPVVVVLVDGFGERQLAHWTAGASPRAIRWRERARPITTTLPSTTTVALTSLSTGVVPGRHGVVGYREYLPQFGVVADLLKMSPVGVPTRDLLVGPGWRPEMVCSAPTIFRRGVNAEIVTRYQFEGSGFTRMIYDGATLAPYATGTELAHQVTRLLSRDAPPPVLFVYWDELDTVQHLQGPRAELVDLELEHVGALMEYVARHVPGERALRTTVLVTGDHGQVPATVAARISLEAEPAIVAEMSRPLSGDRRAGFLSARPGRLDALEAALHARLPAGSTILHREEALTAGLFGPGPHHPELGERIGDLVVLVPSPAGLTYLTPGTAPGRDLEGAHGGLEADELHVPLVNARLAELAPTAARDKR